MNEREAMITLALVPSIDLARFQNLIATAGSACDATGRSPRATGGLRPPAPPV